MQVLWLAYRPPEDKKSIFSIWEFFCSLYLVSCMFSEPFIAIFQFSFVVILSLLLEDRFQPEHVASEICFGLGRASFNRISWSPFMYHRWQSFQALAWKTVGFLSKHMLKNNEGAKWWNFCYWIIPTKN